VFRVSPLARRLGSPVIAAFACLTLRASGAESRPVGDVPGASSSTVLVITVADAVNGAMIADAQVRLPTLGRLERTKWNGEAQFSGLASGTYRIQVKALGYAPGDIDLPVKGDTIGIHFELERVSTALDTVRIVEAAPLRGMKEFENRRRMGLGRFMTDSALRDERTHDLRYVLTTRFPGITTTPHGERLVGMDGCNILMYLDGYKLAMKPKDAIDLHLIRTNDLAGIEVYSLASAPVQYRPTTDGFYCKVILLWSRW
jgi:hypothetical protein